MKKKSVKKISKFTYYRGFTLIELILALAIGSMVLLVVTGILIAGLNLQSSGYVNYKTQDDAIVTMNAITNEMRQATKVVAASAQSFTFQEYVKGTDTTPSQVRFFLSTSYLQKGTISASGTGPNWTFNPASETVKTLAFGVSSGAGAIFSFYDQNGVVLTAPVVVGNITLVQVDLKFSQAPKPDLVVSSRVQLRFNKTNL